MSIYRLIFGVHPLSFCLTPILFDQHPDTLPRFNDAILEKKDDRYIIRIIARIGAVHQNCNMGEELYFNHPNYIGFEDGLYQQIFHDRKTAFLLNNTQKWNDKTYGSFLFSIPDKWYDDIVMCAEETNFQKTSGAFKKLIIDMYPKIYNELLLLFTKNKMKTKS